MDHGAFGMYVLSKLPLITPKFLFLFDAHRRLSLVSSSAAARLYS